MYKTLIVTDSDDVSFKDLDLEVISFQRYLRDFPKINEPKTRIINLCDTEHYLSKGYYCSLVAEARQHKVLPTVSTINDLREMSQTESFPATGRELAQIDLKTLPLDLFAFFGKVEMPSLQRLVRRYYERFSAPILKFSLQSVNGSMQLQIRRVALDELSDSERQRFTQELSNFTRLVWRSPSAKKRLRWEMAIMINPEEKTPPSSPVTISRFVRAAAQLGINAEVITAKEATSLSQFDALFIRETTAIDHHTYRIARRAEQEGLVVIDDPTSILRCCNKIYLHDAFSYKNVPSLRTIVVDDYSDEVLDNIERQFEYPIVLKMPESSFSKGVFRVNDRKELSEKLEELLRDTALMLVQEYVYTEFDWRIGVLNGRAIYACRYHMAKNHWQIYDHGGNSMTAGDSETLPTFEAPKIVLDAAIKASNIIGNGLYGVDIKHKGNQAYVIEVNDNPSLDHKVEDDYLGNELYMLVMNEFARRIEKRGR